MPDSTDGTPRTAREIAHAEMQDRILQAARRQLKTVGPAQLSLRAIAREIGVVSSAIYRYVASRDQLITRLILQSFQELGGAVAEACARVDSDSASQFRTWAHARRGGGDRHPDDRGLIYRAPLAYQHAP